MTQTNRQWLLASRPVGMVSETDFELRETPAPTPGDGQVLVRARWLAFEPAMRGWIEDRPNYTSRPCRSATSCAAGATGSVVGQIAKLKGCRAIGIAGGEAKCKWLTENAGFDGAIDYKNEDVGERLDALCPDGIGVFFDNVGGPILDEALARIARGARVVVCGAISAYNLEKRPPGPSHYYRIVAQRGRMEGFVVIDYLPRAAEATADLLNWVAEGKIRWEADVQHGFENAPKTLLRLYSGANFGKQLLEL